MRRTLAACGLMLAMGVGTAVAQAALPEAPAPQTNSEEKKLLIGPANCVSPAYAATNPEAASEALVESKPCTKSENPFNRFLSTSEPHPMSPQQKLLLAERDFTDVFNLLTIAGNSAIYIGSNAHNPYGPGMRGYGYNVGVSLSQDATGEFVNTFLIPSLFRQDPHYHRMPTARLMPRIVHVVMSVVVMQNDYGRPMFNYADFVGFPIDAELSNLYVPGLQTNVKATGVRVAVGLATVPIGNAIAEFLPDLARHVNLHVIFVQRIINQVAREGGSPDF
ncbi:MAG: hypothetical protein P4L10_05895 [Acidobacteriaceae bacterium]|nr:hypothetical protein [Acidobacteriaceae bacterium]